MYTTYTDKKSTRFNGQCVSKNTDEAKEREQSLLCASWLVNLRLVASWNASYPSCPVATARQGVDVPRPRPLLSKDRAFLHDGARERLVGGLSIPVRGLLGSVKWVRDHEVRDHEVGTGSKGRDVGNSRCG